MPRVRPPLDLETVLIVELVLDAGLGALVGGTGPAARISTRLPSTFKTEGRLRLSRTGGGPAGRVGTSGGSWPDHLDRALVDLHAYGADDQNAYAVAAQAVRALAELEGKTVAGGVITAVDRMLGPTWLPDPDAGDAPRYLVQVAVTAHPAP